MAVEIEKKYRLPTDRIRKLKEQLGQISSDHKNKRFEENIIYGGGSLDRSAAIIRIRKTPDSCILTYKRRIEDRFDAKHQIEYESEFSDPGSLKQILSELGFQPRLVYEKHRETWIFADVEVVIDELPFGTFMEIEGPVNAIGEAEKELSINDLVVEHETYPQLTARLGSNVNGVIEARF